MGIEGLGSGGLGSGGWDRGGWGRVGGRRSWGWGRWDRGVGEVGVGGGLGLVEFGSGDLGSRELGSRGSGELGSEWGQGGCGRRGGVPNRDIIPAPSLTPTVFQAADSYSTSYVSRQIVLASSRHVPVLSRPRNKSSQIVMFKKGGYGVCLKDEREMAIAKFFIF